MKRSHVRRSVGAFGLAMAGILLLAGVLAAHDFWIVPDAYAISTTSRIGGAVSDSADIVAVVTGYQNALAAGDSSAALALLAADAVILESGGVETRAEYRSHHLPGDIGFVRAVPSVRANLRVVQRGDVAWVSSTSTARGEFRGRQINSSGAELMVLTRESEGWKIRAIHWSSRNRTP